MMDMSHGVHKYKGDQQVDILTEIFKRCLRDSDFRKRFVDDPWVTIASEGYSILEEDYEFLHELRDEVKLS